MKRKVYAFPYMIWMIVFILIPMFLIACYAFTENVDGRIIFTMQNIKKAVDPLFLGVLIQSVWLAIISTVICLVLGYPISYMLSRMSPKKASILSMLFILPMWMNFLLRTYAMMTLLDTTGIVNNFLSFIGVGPVQLLYNSGAVVLGMVYNFLPFMILPIYNSLQKIPKSNIEAAQDLGADSLLVFSKVVLPMSMPGIITGITMVFIPAISTFAISRLLGGSQYMLYGDLIENQFLQVRDWNFGSALSVLLIAIVLVSMVISSKYDTQGEGGTLL